MSWDAISAVAETVGTLAVLITLTYLAEQLRIGNKQREMDALRHNWDGLNRMCELSVNPLRKHQLLKETESQFRACQQKNVSYLSSCISAL